jgi:hypothetical protein
VSVDRTLNRVSIAQRDPETKALKIILWNELKPGACDFAVAARAIGTEFTVLYCGSGRTFTKDAYPQS